jgi:hypothetical protein
MSNLLEETRRRVLAEGPCQAWRHESANLGAPDLTNLTEPAEIVYEQSVKLMEATEQDDHDAARKAAFTIIQNLFPIVEALDTDAGLYLGQAAEALRR